MRYLPALFFLIGSLNCQRLSVDLNIEEHGTRYRQTVEYDPVTKVVPALNTYVLYYSPSRQSPTECPSTTMSTAASTSSMRIR